MRKTHLLSGLLFFGLFLASGRHMSQILPAFTGELDGLRMLYRASHVYLLFASLLNLLAGAYWQPVALRRRTQLAGSALLLLSQPVLGLAFLLEPAQNMVARPFTLTGAVLALAGVVLSMFAQLGQGGPRQA
ncbi:hypothetical protein [Pseudomonas sp. N040]|uniref:hypothetical protein n=1 Tax=Pseudomonas sp. N040 TaxID=2785325 RepID=UPI0018A2DA87|nr:hypothetical protein [Pseudomonas sp. N040]MBF7731045.1 hypothetical protein [Pseudomonas sp. N040]MBW7014688.1 hypothetical protein [Pseudomonas sp. N040]